MEITLVWRLAGTLVLDPQGLPVRGTVEHRLAFPSLARAIRLSMHFSADYVRELARLEDPDEALAEAALRFWRQARVEISGYPGIEDGPVADADGFLADELRREHASQAALAVIGQIRGQEDARLAPLSPSG